jgi:hypothetical protein
MLAIPIKSHFGQVAFYLPFRKVFEWLAIAGKNGIFSD